MATLVEFITSVNGNKPDSLQAFLSTMSLEDAKPHPEAASPPTNIFPNPDETPSLGSIPRILDELKNAEMREQLLDRIISTAVDAHLETCIYTSDKVSNALESIEQRGGAPNMPDPSKMNPAMMWQKFMANFMPVITRITRFCKHLPGFQDLCAEDQVRLIKQGAFEVMVCRYSLLIDPETNEMYDPNLEVRIPRGVMSRLPVGEVFDEFFTFAAKVRPMNLSDEEIGLLTTVMVFCPDRMGLQDRGAIYKLQGLYLQALRIHTERNHPGNHAQFLEEMLSVIPILRKINFAHARLMTNMKQGNANMNGALPDTHKKMFDGKI